MWKCNKKKFDKIKVMMIIANAKKPSQKNHNRRESKYYFCLECGAYHTTSKG